MLFEISSKLEGLDETPQHVTNGELNILQQQTPIDLGSPKTMAMLSEAEAALTHPDPNDQALLYTTDAGTTDLGTQTNVPAEVAHLNYMIDKMGLSPKTAMIMLQMSNLQNAEDDIQDPIAKSYHDTLAKSILNDLEREMLASNEVFESS